MGAYYNEFDPKAAAWLRELIRCGHIADGVVDERSIEDVTPADLAGHTQVHFFAGIGVWSYALRAAGWPDDRPVWTGSCPCPPFSAAGKGQQCPECGSKRNLCHPRKTGHFICLDCGCDRHADGRHLWPEFSRLIRQCQPPVVFGEQVASQDGRYWLDAVSADLWLAHYGVGSADLCAAGVGAPHIRQRLWWAAERLANNDSERRGEARSSQPPTEWAERTECGSDPFGLGDDDDERLEGQRGRHQAEGGWVGAAGPVAEASEPGGLADSDGDEPRPGRDGGSSQGEGLRSEPSGCSDAGGLADHQRQQRPGGTAGGDVSRGRDEEPAEVAGLCRNSRPGPTNGVWADADWLFCRDGRWRPVEPGTFPLAHGAAERVGRLRGYGNAIVAPCAQAFIEAYLEAAQDRGFRMTALSDLSHGVFD